MWRVARRGFVSRHRSLTKSGALHSQASPRQVLLNSSRQTLESSSHYTTGIPKKPFFFQNLRLFSSDQESSPSLLETDSNLSIDEIPAVISPESDENVSNTNETWVMGGESDSLFGENEGKVEFDGENWVTGVEDDTILSENAEKVDFDGENLVMGGESDSLFGENEGKVELDGENWVTGVEDDTILSENAEKVDFDGENLVMGGENKTLLGETVEKVELNVEQLEYVLSLLQSSGGDESSGGGDGSLETSFNDMGLTLNEEFVLRVLETPNIPGEKLLTFYQWCLKKPEFSATVQTIDALVMAICGEMKKKNGYALWDLLKEIGEKEKHILSTRTLNDLISLFSRLGKGKAACEVFDKMSELGCVADSNTYYYTIEALCRRSFYDWAGSITKKMLSGSVLPNSEKTGKIISFLCKGNKSRDAHSVYLLAKEKTRLPPRSVINFLISSLARLPKKNKASIKDETDKICRENIYLALNMLEDFSEEDRKYASKTFPLVIHALCKIGDVERAKESFYKMINSGPPPGNDIFNSIINALSKTGDLEESIKLLKTMEDRGLKPDVYTYSVIMSGYVNGGSLDEARKLLEEAKKNHSKLSPVTFHTLIRGYCKLEQFDEAVKLLMEMKDYGVSANADEYNKMIQTLCMKCVDWGMAEKLLEEMKAKGLYLDGLTKGLVKAVKELEQEEKEKGIEEEEEVVSVAV